MTFKYFPVLNPPPMFQPDALQKMINNILSPARLSVSSVEHLPRHHLHRLIVIHLANESRLFLKLSPPPTVLLLRHERHLLEQEALTLLTLAKSNLPIPQILKFEPKSIHVDSPFLLTSYIPGLKYSEALPYLSRSEKMSIEAQLASLQSVLTQHSSHKFGPAGYGRFDRMDGAFRSWREAFTMMLESVMHDGEDMMVNISYFEIRAAVRRWGSYLDEVTDPKLVVLDFGKPENVLIDRRKNEVVGLLDLSMAVWGDPAMGQVEGKTDIRSLLYTCYFSIITIVRNHYRADNEGGELAARAALTTALLKLSSDG